MSPERIIFDLRIAMRIADDELRAARMLGYSEVDAFNRGFMALDESLELSKAPMPAFPPTWFK